MLTSGNTIYVITKIISGPTLMAKRVNIVTRVWLDGILQKDTTDKKSFKSDVWVVVAMFKVDTEGSQYEWKEAFECKTQELASEIVPGWSFAR